MSFVAWSWCRDHSAHDDTGVITDFLFITTCDWELTNQLIRPIIAGISGYRLRLMPNKERTHLIDVGQNGKGHHGLCYHEKQQGKQLPCR